MLQGKSKLARMEVATASRAHPTSCKFMVL